MDRNPELCTKAPCFGTLRRRIRYVDTPTRRRVQEIDICRSDNVGCDCHGRSEVYCIVSPQALGLGEITRQPDKLFRDLNDNELSPKTL